MAYNIYFHQFRQVAQELEVLRERMRQNMPDNPACFGRQIYSQCDEDGIIGDCLRRIESIAPLSRNFIEFGCGNGLENNSHFLLLSGYSGCWIDGDCQNMQSIQKQLNPPCGKRLLAIESFVTLEILDSILKKCCDFLETKDIDFFSMDLDGNDLYFTEYILGKIKPKLLCVEYNAKFPLPVSCCIRYHPSHVWHGDDYQGASLQAWITALGNEYTLVSCSLSGVNAFFVRSDLTDPFTLYPADIIYQQPRPWMVPCVTGLPPSYHWLQKELKCSEYLLDQQGDIKMEIKSKSLMKKIKEKLLNGCTSIKM
ncbi:hypothetical protein FACS1894206_08870 [Deltaproteobacteria bacterium]|nr:hypothetical protein FACS1894206_08870 [Deltaproteobacteria bacterium]